MNNPLDNDLCNSLVDNNDRPLRILLLTFYYPPDLAAGSFRSESMVKALQDIGGENIHIDVMTSKPHRYASHASAVCDYDKPCTANVTRFKLPKHHGGKMDQIWAYLHYANSVRKEIKGKRWDVVVATSSRLMTAVLGAYISRKVGASLYLDVRDLFTDTVTDVFSRSLLRKALPIFKKMESYALSRAQRVNLVSDGFVEYMKSREPKHDYRVFTNGVDESFLEKKYNKKSGASSSSLLVVYAGNMGQGQGLHRILPYVAKELEGKVVFRLIGDGGCRELLENALIENNIKNVDLFPALPREQLFSHYRDADVLFLHLNNYSAFRKVLPSKLFEYAATGKPILAGVSGYTETFIASEVPGSYVFYPCDSEGMISQLKKLLISKKVFDRHEFVAKFSRKKIMSAMAKDIIELAESNPCRKGKACVPIRRNSQT